MQKFVKHTPLIIVLLLSAIQSAVGTFWSPFDALLLPHMPLLWTVAERSATPPPPHPIPRAAEPCSQESCPARYTGTALDACRLGCSARPSDDCSRDCASVFGSDSPFLGACVFGCQQEQVVVTTSADFTTSSPEPFTVVTSADPGCQVSTEPNHAIGKTASFVSNPSLEEPPSLIFPLPPSVPSCAQINNSARRGPVALLHARICSTTRENVTLAVSSTILAARTTVNAAAEKFSRPKERHLLSDAEQAVFLQAIHPIRVCVRRVAFKRGYQR